MRWQYKCLIDGCKGVLPFQDQLRALKYRLIAYKPDPPSTDAWTIQEGLIQLEWIRGIRSIQSAAVLEIGTGWQPMIPILFSLAGARCVYLTDLNRLCTPTSFHVAICSVRRLRRVILDSLQISETEFDEATSWEQSAGLEEGFRRLRLQYLAPCDCRRVPLPDGSIDIISSRAVLEHIPPRVIQDIFTDSFRLLRPKGIACHFVDNSDHWSHQDKSITTINFLKLSEAVFRLTCLNSLNYQNRLRHSEYVDFLHGSGFNVLRQYRHVDSKAVAAVQNLAIMERFRRFPAEELATISSYLLSEKPQCAV